MKVIFLDIDGVLNVHLPERDQYGSLFHVQFECNLKHIIDETNAKIVISSSWRHSGLSVMQEMWKYRNLPGEVIGVTPSRSQHDINENCSRMPFNERLERGWEIQEWVDSNSPDKYCIIDDDNDMLPHQLKFFVQTMDNWDHEGNEEGYGLTKECAKLVIDILK